MARMLKTRSRKTPRGYLMLLAIVFGAIFLTILGALSGFVLTENRVQNAATSKSKGLAIAEAGVEYYRWFLAHNPGDLQNGTGHAGPYTIPYDDPEGGQTGTIALSISGSTSCGVTNAIDIQSTGTPKDDSAQSKTIIARYAEPSVAAFSYIINDSVWAGSDRTILGPYHSNGGIHMDGTVNSPVTSSLSAWSCGSSYGCSPTQSSAPGVLGSGTNQNLWSYPTPQVDFAGIAANFSSLKTTASAQGLYFPRISSGTASGASYWKGYHLIFNGNGTITVKKVTGTTALTVTPINSADSTTDHTLISTESVYGTYAIPANCGLIFVEDNTWVEGVVDAKVTVIAANVTTTGVAPNLMLPDNITYGVYDGTDGLTAIAENDVLIAADSPATMTLNGIFIAQNGAFGRNLFDCPGTYEPRTALTIRGTTVSNLRTGTKWVNGCFSHSTYSNAGYQTRTDAYDRQLATDPPPFTPYTSSDYQFVEWREK